MSFMRESAAAALAAGFVSSGHVHALPQRWNIDVLGVTRGVSTGLAYHETQADMHTYFIADDLDGSGEITRNELIDDHVLPRDDYGYLLEQGLIRLEQFHYAPDTGLRYEAFGMYAYFNLGSYFYAGKFEGVSYLWHAGTSTTITGPMAVPEPSSVALALSGLGVALLARRRGRA